MIVTNLEPHTKARIKVYVDQELAFVLYKGELTAYGIKVGEELTQEDYQLIMKELLPKRAKLRSMNLLKSKDYTEKQLRDKLRDGFYPQEVIEEAVAYVKSYHYIDDARFAESYITYYSESRSRRRIEQDLGQKGIAKEVIELAYSEAAEKEKLPDETKLIEEQLRKKHFDKENATYEEKQKITAFLYRKGFRIDGIRKVLSID